MIFTTKKGASQKCFQRNFVDLSILNQFGGTHNRLAMIKPKDVHTCGQIGYRERAVGNLLFANALTLQIENKHFVATIIHGDPNV